MVAMQYLARDIKLTLLIKFTLLLILWWVCFKPAEKPVINTQLWLLGSVSQPNTTDIANTVDQSSPKS
jgi:hypothetical protein